MVGKNYAHGRHGVYKLHGESANNDEFVVEKHPKDMGPMQNTKLDNNCNSTTFGNPPTFGNHGGNTYYTYEQFCCADIGSTVMVQMVVVDGSGSSSF